MIDFHCHIDLFPDPWAIVSEINRRGCYVLAVTTTPLSWEGTSAIVGSSSRVRVALGLHPELIAQRHGELDIFVNLLPQARYIGEIGIDGSDRHRDSFALQESVFSRILKSVADSGGRIMSIHSRKAATPVLDLIKIHRNCGIPVLHWFTGSMGELRRALDLNCWFSVGPAMLRTKRGMSLLQNMPKERVLTESDGPFARIDQISITPWMLDDASKVLQQVWGVDEREVNQQLERNFRELLSFGS